MTKLVPVGGEFAYAYPPSNGGFRNDGFAAGATTAPHGEHFTVWRYRVTAHNEGRMVLEPIDEPGNPRYIAPKEWALRHGRLVPIPPDELLPFMDPSWVEPVDYLKVLTAYMRAVSNAEGVTFADLCEGLTDGEKAALSEIEAKVLKTGRWADHHKDREMCPHGIWLDGKYRCVTCAFTFQPEKGTG